MAAIPDSAVQKRFADLSLDVPPPDQQTAAALGTLQKGENREMVADHRGRRHQSGVKKGGSARRRVHFGGGVTSKHACLGADSANNLCTGTLVLSSW
jgi:hypothetical protein